MAQEREYPINTGLTIHNATGFTLRTHSVVGDDGPVRWLTWAIKGPAGSEVSVTVHAGRNPALWRDLQALEQAWEDAQLLPQPTPADLAQADEVLDGEGRYDE